VVLKRSLVCLFLALLLGMGLRGIVADDSRLSWRMFPYVLRYQVDYTLVMADGTRRPWKPGREQRNIVKRQLKPGAPLDGWYGVGAARAWVLDYLRFVAHHKAPTDMVAIEANFEFHRGAAERAAQREVLRVDAPAERRPIPSPFSVPAALLPAVPR
jgi:hypothetical protein